MSEKYKKNENEDGNIQGNFLKEEIVKYLLFVR